MRNEIGVFILARDRDLQIASTIFKIKNQLKVKLGIPTKIYVVDNGSKDDTAYVSRKAGAKVFRYEKRKPRNIVISKALENALKRNFSTYVFLDSMGGNTAEDVIGLVEAALDTGEKFASGYVVPERGLNTIGCIALDRDSLELLARQKMDVTDFLVEMGMTGGLNKRTLNQAVIEYSKKKKRSGNKEKKSLIQKFRDFRREHPLKIYGGLGMIVLLFSLGSGFYTVDYFYKNQSLYYPTTFVTVILVMIAGFLLVAGLMLNALNMLVEKVRASKKWEKATCEEVSP